MQRKINVNSKQTKMCHYKHFKNVQSAHWPDVFGVRATKVNTGRGCCASFSSFHGCTDLCKSILPSRLENTKHQTCNVHLVVGLIWRRIKVTSKNCSCVRFELYKNHLLQVDSVFGPHTITAFAPARTNLTKG